MRVQVTPWELQERVITMMVEDSVLAVCAAIKQHVPGRNRPLGIVLLQVHLLCCAMHPNAPAGCLAGMAADEWVCVGCLRACGDVQALSI